MKRGQNQEEVDFYEKMRSDKKKRDMEMEHINNQKQQEVSKQRLKEMQLQEEEERYMKERRYEMRRI